MLVEDDNNLREIYEARLAAEGYEIISAADGEAALALAIKERPDLIISDIMMPKVSGFDMLDILRSTTETKHTKIIMMTALNQVEDKEKAEELGADLYLVKSQVTLEDVVRSAKNLLGEETPLSVGGIPIHQPNNATAPQAQNMTSLSESMPVPMPSIAAPVSPAAPATQATNPTTPVVAIKTPPQPISPQVPMSQPSTSTNVDNPAPLANSNTAQTPIAQPIAAPDSISQSVPTANPVAETQNLPPIQSITNEVMVSASNAKAEEAILKEKIEQYISEDTNPNEPSLDQTLPPLNNQPQATESTNNSATATPAISVEPIVTTTPPQPATPAQTTPSIEISAPPAPIASSPTETAPSSIPNSIAQPPSYMAANTPVAGDPSEDRPAGEQVLAKNASTDVTSTESGIDASVSGRKKVINPINDIITPRSNLNNLAANEREADAPTISSVVTPEGITLSTSNGTPTMNDVIPPTPAQTNQNTTPQPPLPPPVA